MKRISVYFGFLLIGVLAIAIPIAVYLGQREQTLTTNAQTAQNAQLTGRVVERANPNKGVKGVVVSSYYKFFENKPETEEGSATTDADGNYTISTISKCKSNDGKGCLHIAKVLDVPDGYVSPPNQEFRVESSDPSPINFVLEGSSLPAPSRTPRATGPKLPDPQSCTTSELRIGDTATGNTTIGIPNPVCLSGIGGVRRLIVLTFDLLMVFVSLASFFMLIWGGVAFVTSGGDPKGTGAAKNRITYAIIGLAVVGFSLVIFMIISRVLGFSIITGNDVISDAVRQEIDSITQFCNNPNNLHGNMTYDSCVASKCSAKHQVGTVDYSNCISLANGGQQDTIDRALAEAVNAAKNTCEAGDTGGVSSVPYNQCLTNYCQKTYNPRNDNPGTTRFHNCRKLAGLE